MHEEADQLLLPSVFFACIWTFRRELKFSQKTLLLFASYFVSQRQRVFFISSADEFLVSSILPLLVLVSQKIVVE